MVVGEPSVRLIELGGGNSKVEKDSCHLRKPESFQYGREVLEIVTNEPNPIGERGEVGPRRLQRLRISIDADELDGRGRVEKTVRMPGSTERCVDDDSPVLQCREESRGDLFCEYRPMFHVGSIVPNHPAPVSRPQPCRAVPQPRLLRAREARCPGTPPEPARGFARVLLRSLC